MTMNHHHRGSDTEDYDKTDTEKDPSVTSGDEDKLRFKDDDDEDQDDVTSSKDSQHAADSDLENSVNHSGKWMFIYTYAETKQPTCGPRTNCDIRDGGGGRTFVTCMLKVA